MTNEDLIKKAKPCPFCGSTDIRFDRQSSGHGESDTVIKCGCGAQIVEYFGPEQALIKWNARVHLDD